MISFLRKLIFKFKPFQVYPALNIKKKNEGDTISNLETRLKKIEKRLIETEKACHLRSSEDRLKDLEEKFEEQINHFPLLERKFIKLEIDKRILKECPETAKNTNYLPWNNPENGKTTDQNICCWYFRIYFLFAAKEKVYKFRRQSFLVIQDNGLKEFKKFSEREKND